MYQPAIINVFDNYSCCDEGIIDLLARSFVHFNIKGIYIYMHTLGSL